ncbi:helix-turn-helix domain-containing protein [Mycobacteroides abscessus]|uniref:helix-turn-helix domain-containing protein n=1 Tax=Mycobacteroides abscessus TaxID=36809 RepID=UPI000E69084C|nr:helix-turn-helix transcriptional regulator [Mycobacteroides abscessus]RIU38684.1 XRE family transcriptional regulator [Mycobacteroides abscessus]
MPEPKKSASQSPRLGAAGDAVRHNVRRLRDAQGVSAAELSKKLAKLRRPIPLVGIQRIEAGTRRVDADDLVALSVALGVSPITLLMPHTPNPDTKLLIAGIKMAARGLWDWLRADRQIPAVQGTILEFFPKALPPWKLAELEQQWAAQTDDEVKRAVGEMDPRVRNMLRGDGSGDDQ